MAEATSIHDWLIQCYRGNETEPIFPNTPQLLIELIRKIENSNPGTADIRTLSAIILHKLRVDGIERVPGVPESKHITPFAPSGIMTPKFQLILRMISNVPNNGHIFKSLSRKELCQLHRMISTTVDPWKRKDEYNVCSLYKNTVAAGGNSLPEMHRHHKIRPVQ